MTKALMSLCVFSFISAVFFVDQASASGGCGTVGQVDCPGDQSTTSNEPPVQNSTQVQRQNYSGYTERQTTPPADQSIQPTLDKVQDNARQPPANQQYDDMGNPVDWIGQKSKDPVTGKDCVYQSSGECVSTGDSNFLVDSILKDPKASDQKQPAVSCTQAAQAAEDGCASDRDSTLNNTLTYIDKFAQGATMATKATGNIQAACSDIARMADTANAALLALKAKCFYHVNQCDNACSADPSPMKADIARCKQASTRLQGIEMQTMSIASQIMDAKKCANQAKTAMQIYCENNPQSSMCSSAAMQMDCRRPENGGNLICKCQANPNTPECGFIAKSNGNSTGTDDSGSAGQSDEQKRRSAATLASLLANMKDTLQPKKMGQGDEGSNSPPAGGGGGGRIGSGGRQQGGGVPSKPSRGGAGYNTAINAGAYGGGGAGGMRSSSSNGGGGYQPGNGIPRQQMPDLRGMLPSNPAIRGIAGISGPDGITGPGSDIFIKINNRYRAIGFTMKP